LKVAADAHHPVEPAAAKQSRLALEAGTLGRDVSQHVFGNRHHLVHRRVVAVDGLALVHDGDGRGRDFFFAVQSPAGEETGTMTAYTEQPP
jgi:hypothetical protein